MYVLEGLIRQASNLPRCAYLANLYTSRWSVFVMYRLISKQFLCSVHPHWSCPGVARDTQARRHEICFLQETCALICTHGNARAHAHTHILACTTFIMHTFCTWGDSPKDSTGRQSNHIQDGYYQSVRRAQIRWSDKSEAKQCQSEKRAQKPMTYFACRHCHLCRKKRKLHARKYIHEHPRTCTRRWIVPEERNVKVQEDTQISETLGSQTLLSTSKFCWCAHGDMDLVATMAQSPLTFFLDRPRQRHWKSAQPRLEATAQEQWCGLPEAPD